MERRDFILKSGMLLTAATFLHSFSGHAGIKPGDKYKKRPDPDNFPQPIMKAIAVGLNAPSPHNTQSWKFKIINAETMFFYVDQHILLPETDPPSRQIHIGAGAFIETLAISITQYGFSADISYFPDGYNNAGDFGIKPVAKITVQKSGIKVHPLAAYILQRQTNRRPSTGDIVSDSLFEELTGLAGKSHSSVLFYNNNLDSFKALFYKGLDIESRTRRTNEETRVLFRFTEKERAAKGDGLSIPQMGYHGLLQKIVENSLKNGKPEIWHKAGTIDKSMKTIKKAIESTRGVVIWMTETNNFHDWIENGRDYVRFSLAATSKNLYLHPYNQPIQEYVEMDAVRTELDKLVGIKNDQKIQFVARIGHSSTPYFSYRRAMDRYFAEGS